MNGITAMEFGSQNDMGLGYAMASDGDALVTGYTVNYGLVKAYLLRLQVGPDVRLADTGGTLRHRTHAGKYPTLHWKVACSYCPALG